MSYNGVPLTCVLRKISIIHISLPFTGDLMRTCNILKKFMGVNMTGKNRFPKFIGL